MLMTLEKVKIALQFEAELYELYVSKIEIVKTVLKAFDGKQVNVRITDSLEKEIPRGDSCIISVGKEESNLRVFFTSNDRYVDVGTPQRSDLFYVDNARESILCKDAVRNGRLIYQAVEPQIDRTAEEWLNEAKEYKTTDYARLIDEYKEIVDSINFFNSNGSVRIKDLLGLRFKTDFTSVC